VFSKAPRFSAATQTPLSATFFNRRLHTPEVAMRKVGSRQRGRSRHVLIELQNDLIAVVDEAGFTLYSPLGTPLVF
jgi:hypothetical protein